jgi:hypothetical protein
MKKIFSRRILVVAFRHSGEQFLILSQIQTPIIPIGRMNGHVPIHEAGNSYEGRILKNLIN